MNIENIKEALRQIKILAGDQNPSRIDYEDQFSMLPRVSVFDCMPKKYQARAKRITCGKVREYLSKFKLGDVPPDKIKNVVDLVEYINDDSEQEQEGVKIQILLEILPEPRSIYYNGEGDGFIMILNLIRYKFTDRDISIAISLCLAMGVPAKFCSAMIEAYEEKGSNIRTEILKVGIGENYVGIFSKEEAEYGDIHIGHLNLVLRSTKRPISKKSMYPVNMLKNL